MLTFKKQYFVSTKLLPEYKQITGRAAEEALEAMGLTHISAMPDGTLCGRDKYARLLNGYRVYEKDVPIFSDKK